MAFWLQPRADEFGGQPVEQFRMRRLRALRAEIVLRLHDAAAEILLPDAIHGDAREQRILRVRHPAGQIQAIELAAGNLGRGSEHAQHGRKHARAVRLVIAAQHDVGFARLRHLAHDQRALDLGKLLLQRVDGFVALLQPRVGGLGVELLLVLHAFAIERQDLIAQSLPARRVFGLAQRQHGAVSDVEIVRFRRTPAGPDRIHRCY